MRLSPITGFNLSYVIYQYSKSTYRFAAGTLSLPEPQRSIPAHTLDDLLRQTHFLGSVAQAGWSRTLPLWLKRI